VIKFTTKFYTKELTLSTFIISSDVFKTLPGLIPDNSQTHESILKTSSNKETSSKIY